MATADVPNVVGQSEQSGAGQQTHASDKDKDKGDLTGTVAKHYNQLQEAGLEERTKSRIFYMRNFNNWLKSMLISEYLTKLRKDKSGVLPIRVLDLCCGKGGDLLKWRKGRIDQVVCADIAGTSVEQCEERFKSMEDRASKERFPQKVFSAEFITADLTKTRLKDSYKDPKQEFELASCQFSFHYSFESYAQADMMLKNACECLRPGGYFIGSTPNSYELVKRLRASDDMSFGNEVYKVTFTTPDKENMPLFGAKYDFHLEGVVDCPEFLVYFPVLEKLAEKYDMKLIRRVPFGDFFDEQVALNDGRGLIGRMQGLEPYPADESADLLCSELEAYSHAHQRVEEKKKEQQDAGDDRRKQTKVGTLSLPEWEATSLYLVFVFQKLDKSSSAPTDAAPETSSEKNPPSPSSSRKRPAEGEASEEPETKRAPEGGASESHSNGQQTSIGQET